MSSTVAMEPVNLVGSEERGIPGEALRSHDPARPDETVWSGSPDAGAVDAAVSAAAEAAPAWRKMGLEKRAEVLRAFREVARERAEEVGELICRETGKALWDSMGEARLLAAKVDVTLDDSKNSGLARVTGFETPVTETRQGRCVFRPHGVMAVVGPFNFPAHLPNGHIVPALLTGNTVVLKPSDKAPAVGQLLGSLYREALAAAGAPMGVVNVVQGGGDVASALVTHEDIEGVLFTGSWPVGRKILEANLDRPSRIVALEMGGNNAAVVAADADIRQAAVECVRAAFVSAGQRCTCTRRIIVEEPVARAFVALAQKIASNLIVGDPRGIGGGSRNQSVFMGPVIREESRRALLETQAALVRAGARPLVEMTAMEHPSGGHYVTPGMLEVDRFTAGGDPASDAGCDEEFFGPLVRVSTARDLGDAIEQANATRFGLASAIFTKSDQAAERFLDEARAGCVNVNTGTAGASSKLPFGGLGISGNHRPAGAFSLDYTAYPVASLIERGDKADLPPGMRVEEGWEDA